MNPFDLVKSVSVRLASPEDAHLEAFDNTKLSAINTCPTWGIVRYSEHKRMGAASRQMALEAGSACHEFFAAQRLVWMLRKQGLAGHFQHHGVRLFGEDRWQGMLSYLDSGEDERTREINFCLQALYSSGFYDDPDDKKRTMTNLEESCIFYFDRYDGMGGQQKIWIEDENDPTSRIGIEVPFDVVVEFHMHDGTTKSYRFTGKADGIHVSTRGECTVQENKTASRLGEAWGQSFQMAHQVTGYCIAASLWTGMPCHDAIALGLCIPLPQRAATYGGVQSEAVKRDSDMMSHWFKWFFHTVTQEFDPYKATPCNAPRFTHSCNRFFHPCSMIPFCAAPDADRPAILEQMEHDEWSPLHDETKAGE